MSPLPRLYTDLADWFHLLTSPADYAEEAEFYFQLAARLLESIPKTWLEMGSGGGNMASHYNSWVTPVLSDLSPPMLRLSATINPGVEHIEGDMRTMRLGRTFDVVFIHDAVMYLTTADDLRAAMETASEHLRPGGVAILAPDCTRETFEPTTQHGGHDDDGRALRYLEWTMDPDPADSTFDVDFAMMLREGGRIMDVVHDHHCFGLFSRDEWLGLLAEVGFSARAETFLHSTAPDQPYEVFCGRKQ